MEELKALISDPLLHLAGTAPRTVLRKCNHTPEEHIAMSTARPQCPGCHGQGQIWNGKYVEDCTCRTFCCKWLTEIQIPVPWCIHHNSAGILNVDNNIVTSTYCEYGRNNDDCRMSLSVVWKTATVSGEKNEK